MASAWAVKVRELSEHAITEWRRIMIYKKSLVGIVLLFGVIYVGLNFLADFSYAVVDPRIRYS